MRLPLEPFEEWVGVLVYEWISLCLARREKCFGHEATGALKLFIRYVLCTSLLARGCLEKEDDVKPVELKNEFM